MITKEEYEKAQQIVWDYEEQLELQNVSCSTLLRLKKDTKKHKKGTVMTEYEWIKSIGRKGRIIPIEGSDTEFFEYCN